MVICVLVHDGEMLEIQAAEVWSETCNNKALILDHLLSISFHLWFMFVLVT